MKQVTAVVCSWLLLLATGLEAAELPVRQVVLYKHGIGYFERAGQLGPAESARLDFKATEMNDVLKSLTIEERGGGKITGLRYDSSDPLEKKLAEYPFRLGQGQPLSAVLDQLKGAIIELRYGAETIRGAILSGRVLPRDDKRPESELLSLLLDSGELRNFDLSGATLIRLVDPTLQAQFQDYLAALVGARSKEKRSVYIDSTGAQNRQIIASYMIPTPVWKSSYRLIWSPQGEPMLEGWAIVDNTTGEDWTNVQLALVSGRPISFISRLYEPRYISRPLAELPEDRAQAPVIHEGAIEEVAASGRAQQAGTGTIEGSVRDSTGAVIPRARITIKNMDTGLGQTLSADAAGYYSAQLGPGRYEVAAQVPGFQTGIQSGIELNVGQRASVNFTLQVGSIEQSMMSKEATPPPPPAYRMRISERALAASTVEATTATQELGELFEYRFAAPVTVRKNESAMLPFLQQKITSRKLLVYKDPSSAHPLNSAEITNSTDKTLDGGPITVYEDNAYAGEALMETLKAGDKRLISYGVDLGTRITTAFDSKGDLVREVHLRRGILTTRTAVVETKTYTIRNVDQKAKTLLIEHPARQQYKVLDQKPVETTTSAYRFQVLLAAGATEKFPVTEERLVENSLAISSLTPDVLVTFTQNKNLSDATRAQLTQILDQKRQIAANDGEIRRAQEQINNLFQDQERIRQNLNSLNRVSGQEQQVQNYSRQLAAQEVQLAALRDKLAQSQQKKVALETALNALIEKMEF